MKAAWPRILTSIVFCFLLLAKIPGVVNAVLPFTHHAEAATEFLVDMETQEEKKGTRAEAGITEDFFEETHLALIVNPAGNRGLYFIPATTRHLPEVFLGIPTPPPNARG